VVSLELTGQDWLMIRIITLETEPILYIKLMEKGIITSPVFNL